jgi:hypothetical protein
MQSMIQRALLIVLLAVTAVWVPRLCNAQEYRATITGTVADSAKAVIPKAAVTVRNLDTGEVINTQTSAAGAYTVPYLRPAQRYEVTVEVPGFKKTTHPAVVLQISQVITLDFALQVGNAASEVVTVVATESQVALDADTADRGTVVDNKTITELPIDGRNPLALLDAVAGVTNENGPGSQGVASDMYNASFYTINGGAAQNTEYTIDGQPDNSIPWWSSGPSSIPSVDAIQEFKIITNPYDAQLGRTSGGVVSMELKSGTNQIHGSAYEFAKRGYMDANHWVNNLTDTPRPAHTEDQYGAEIAGPVRIPHLYNGRDKTFFMFNAEFYRQKLPQYGMYDVPNPAWVKGDFSGFTDGNGDLYPVYDVNTANAANGYARSMFQTANTGSTTCGNAQGYNCVPTNRFNPIAVNIVNMAISAMTPTPNAIAGEQPWENIWVNRQPENNTMDNYIAKVDQVLGAKDRMSFNYIHDTNLVQFLFTPSGVPWANGEHFQENHQNAGIDWIHTQRDNLLFDVHTSYQRYWRADGEPQTWNYDTTQLGWSSAFINSLPLKTGFPQITWSMQQPSSAQGQGYGNWPLMSRDRYMIPDDTFSIAPTVTWNKQKHSLRAGVDLRTTHTSADTNWTNVMEIGSNGEASQEYWDAGSYDDGAQLPDGMNSAGVSGNAFLDFLLGQPNTVTVQNQVTPTYTWHYIAPWVQDDWKVTPRFTVNLGFRYDLASAPTARHNWLSTGFDLNATNPLNTLGLAAQFPNLQGGKLEGGYTFATSGGRSAAWNTDYTKYQPRLGFAYLLRPTTVIRGGAGRLVQAQMGDQPSTVGYSQAPNFVNTIDSGETYVNSGTPDGMLSNPYFNSGGIPTIPGASAGLATNVGLGASFMNPNHKWPYVYQYSLGLQQSIGSTGKLDISYVGSSSRAGDESSQNLSMDEDLRATCNDLLGTTSNPEPRMNCQARVPNPLYGVAGVQGSWESSPTISALNLNAKYPLFANSVTENGMNWGKSWYNSLQTTYSQRTDWEQFTGSWTWSKTMQSGGYVDSNYLVPMRSIAGADRTHRFTLTGVVNAPVGRGKKYFSNLSRPVDAVFGGWEIGESFFLETGQPFSMPSGYNLLGDIHGPKMNQSGNYLQDLGVNHCVWQWNPSTTTAPGYFKPNPGVTQPFNCNQGSGWYPTSAPYSPVTSQPYSAAIRAPGTSQLDMNLAKMFNLTKQVRMQTRMEVTNVFNHPTFYWDVSNSPTAWDFGTVDKSWGQSNNPRYVQIAVKVLW